jgi:hypothetical protein
MMNSIKYEEVVRRKVIPVLNERWSDGSGIFQQEKVACHVSKKMLEFFQNHNIRVLDWPGNSPDLNPIQNFWAIIKKRLHKRDCTSLEKLVNAVIDIWFRDPEISSMCKKLVESMPGRVEQVILHTSVRFIHAFNKEPQLSAISLMWPIRSIL